MKKLIAALIVVTCFGCFSLPAAIAPSSSPLEAGTRGTVWTRGESCQYWLLGFVPLNREPSTHHALHRAKKTADAHALTDVTVDWFFAYFVLWSQHCAVVEGLGVRESGRNAPDL